MAEPNLYRPEAEDELQRFLASLMLGQSPESAEMGVKHPMDPSYMKGATGLSQAAKSPYEKTLRPGEWDTLTDQEKRLRGLEMLGEVVLGSGVENIPSVGPRRLEDVVKPALSRKRQFRGNRPVPTDFSAAALGNLTPAERSSLLDMATPSELRYAEWDLKKNPVRRPAEQAFEDLRLRAERARPTRQVIADKRADEIADLKANLPPEEVAKAEKSARDVYRTLHKPMGVPEHQALPEELKIALLKASEQYHMKKGAFGGQAPSEAELGGLFEAMQDSPGDAPGVQPGFKFKTPEETGFKLVTPPEAAPAKPYNIEDIIKNALLDSQKNPVTPAKNQADVDALHEMMLKRSGLDIKKPLTPEEIANLLNRMGPREEE